MSLPIESGHVSSSFFRPMPGGGGEWWGRCELCRYSGPMRHFEVLVRGEDLALVCIHSWCFGSASVRDELLKDGWSAR